MQSRQMSLGSRPNLGWLLQGHRIQQPWHHARLRPCDNLWRRAVPRSTATPTATTWTSISAVPIAASTHPFSHWSEQGFTDMERYTTIANDLQAVVRRLLICGMHVHVGIEDDELRIDLMNQMRYFLPHLLALTTSSPFWQGENTGLKSYRLSVWDEMPRTGLPNAFDSYAEYERHVAALVNAGVHTEFSYVSAAGGAFLEWLEGKDLPGVAVLRTA